MGKIYKYKLMGISIPKDISLDAYGTVSYYTKYSNGQSGMEYFHRQTFGTFVVTNKVVLKDGASPPKYDVDLITTENIDHIKHLYYESSPSKSLWWMNGYDDLDIITSIIIPNDITNKLPAGKLPSLDYMKMIKMDD